jgi:CubicO group peptidase (beta-lactamase class C family)
MTASSITTLAFKLHDPYVTAALTIRDTYSHRSGLPEHVGDLLEDMGYDRAEVLRRLRFVPTKNNFRSHYAYTNFGLTEGAVALPALRANRGKRSLRNGSTNVWE